MARKTRDQSESAGRVAKANLAVKKFSELVPAEYNPRTIKDRNLSNLRDSIAKFSYVELIVWNKKTGNVVGGHQRIKALAAEGFNAAEVVVVDLDEKEEKALNVTLNNDNLRGEWDVAKLQAIFPDIADFDVGGLQDLATDFEIKTEFSVGDSGESEDFAEGEQFQRKGSATIIDIRMQTSAVTEEFKEKLSVFIANFDPGARVRFR